MTTLPSNSSDILHLTLPKGRIEEQVIRLLSDARMELLGGGRSYRPRLSTPGLGVKLLKPQNIVEMLAAGSRDVGFTGADWVAEKDANLIELLDTGLDPVRLVAESTTNPLPASQNGSQPVRGLV